MNEYINKDKEQLLTDLVNGCMEENDWRNGWNNRGFIYYHLICCWDNYWFCIGKNVKMKELYDKHKQKVICFHKGLALKCSDLKKLQEKLTDELWTQRQEKSRFVRKVLTVYSHKRRLNGGKAWPKRTCLFQRTFNFKLDSDWSITQLLVEKGVLTFEEVFEKLKEVQKNYKKPL